MRVPQPRGPVSAAVLTYLRGPSPASFTTLAECVEQVLERDHGWADEDLQLTLFIVYAMHFDGLDGVCDSNEWDPKLLGIVRDIEAAFELGLRADCAPLVEEVAGFECSPAEDSTAARVRALCLLELAPSVSSYIRASATFEQLRELLINKSVYQLKEADPHTFTIPRLRGRAKAALVEIQSDEYGNGVPGLLHATMFADTMVATGLHPTFGRYVDHVSAAVLMQDNSAVMFGLHRRLRGATVGHLSALEMTSSAPMRAYSQGLGRLGLDWRARAYFEEHVGVDAVHEQVAALDMIPPLVAADPCLADDVLFGAAACVLLDAAVARESIAAWTNGASALRRPLDSADLAEAELAVVM